MEQPVRIIVGLGNPGRDYAETRHNVGFMVLERLARRYGATWKMEKFHRAEVAAGPGVLLVKPQTFMNASGESAGSLMRYFKFAPEQVLVVYDDISFPVGTMRLRAGGSAGGHNGMKSIIAHLGTERFPRLRIGIGVPGQKNMVGHVLGKFAPEEQPMLEEALSKAEAAAAMVLSQGFQAAANQFNIRKEKKKKSPVAAECAETTAPAAIEQGELSPSSSCPEK